MQIKAALGEPILKIQVIIPPVGAQQPLPRLRHIHMPHSLGIGQSLCWFSIIGAEPCIRLASRTIHMP